MHDEIDRRTRALLEAPITPTLLRLAWPNMLVMVAQAAVGLVDAGSRYLHAVGPFYGMFGLGLALYFAAQGAGRLLWPLVANLTRLAIAALIGWLALRWSGDLSHLFLAQSLALVSFGLINAVAVAGGSWLGALTWPWGAAGALQRRSST